MTTEQEIYQWWALISEAERREIVASVPGCIEYGSVRSTNALPEEGRRRVRVAYARHQKLMADLESARGGADAPRTPRMYLGLV